MSFSLNSPVGVLRGIGPVKQKALARLGIFTVRDLLFHIPRGFEDRSRVRTLAEGADGVAAGLTSINGAKKLANTMFDANGAPMTFHGYAEFH